VDIDYYGNIGVSLSLFVQNTYFHVMIDAALLSGIFLVVIAV
jgi:hypothetical protein